MKCKYILVTRHNPAKKDLSPRSIPVWAFEESSNRTLSLCTFVMVSVDDELIQLGLGSTHLYQAVEMLQGWHKIKKKKSVKKFTDSFQLMCIFNLLLND